jgi:hypothetical protein
MSMNPKVKNPLIMTVVSTVFLIPVLILSHFLFRDAAVDSWLANPWIIISANVVIYFVLIFLVFLYYGNIGRK